MGMDARLMAGYASLAPIYVDGIGGLWPVGNGNFATGYYRNRPVKSDGWFIITEPMPTAVLIRPRSGACHTSGCEHMATVDGNPSKSTARDFTRANIGEFFATGMGVIQRTPEFVRIPFFSQQQAFTIALPPSAFASAAWQITSCRDGVAH